VWLLFHHEQGTKVVRGGHTFVEQCPTCGDARQFREVETSEKAGIWFINLDDETKRGFRCDGCGDVFSLREEPAPAAKPAQPASPAKVASPAKPERDEQRIEDELAELKKRLGR
jgi:hypothetical protein